MSFKTVSAILYGAWAIDEHYAQTMLPLVQQMISGETVNFGLEKPTIAEPKPYAATPGVYSVGVGTNVQSVPNEGIAVVDIIGPVMKYGDLCSYGSIEHAQLISDLAASENVSAIILNIDSPGGQVAGITLLADAIKEATTHKPVVAMINDGIAASAAMWIASAATEIYCTKKSDEVGSIGAFYQLVDVTGAMEKQGIKIRQIYATKSTDKNGPVREALAGNDAPLIEELDITVQDFFDTITANRGDRLKGDAWQTGKMFRAKEATKMGLIDGVKSFDQIIKRTQQLINTNKIMNNTSMTNATDATGATENGGTGEAVLIAHAGTDPVITAFAHILQAAGMEAIAVVDGGFLFEEANLNALEQFITASRESANQLNLDLAAARLENERLQNDLNALQAGNTELQSRIDTINARVAELENGPDGSFSETVRTTDDPVKNPTANFLTSYDQEKARILALKNS